MTTVERIACTEASPHHFVTEASNIELPIGEWPHRLETKMGNGQPFILTSVTRDNEGDVMCAHYNQMLGCISLIVFND